MKLKLIVLFLITLTLNSCKIGRFFVYNFADIKDYKKFPSRTVEKGDTNFQFAKGDKYIMPKKISLGKKENTFEEFLDQSATVAFLVIQNDTIKYEHYSPKYDEASIVPSFSMAKSITSILIGCAIDDHLIKSVNEPVTNYIPELKDQGFDTVSIEQVLQMTTQIKFNESYVNPFGDAATFYYGTNLRRSVSKMKLKSKPSSPFDYTSGNTQILGLILERALNGKTISTYLEEKLWQPLQMEYDASWSLDRKKDGLEKTFCCVNARARDFAKIGRLYLNKGNWNGTQIVSEDWVNQSTKVDTTNGSAWYYQYQWWLPTKDGDFTAQGILGQYIYVNPNKNMIIVRLGKKRKNVNWTNFLVTLSEKL